MLDEIVALAVDSKQPVSVLLRKCLVLAHQLKNERLKEWANQELNGYKSIEGLPDYRVIPAGAQGSFAGPGGAFIRRRNIPSAVLEEQHQRWAETVYLVQAISAYDNILTSKHASVMIPWDNNLILHYQAELIDGFALVSACQEIPKSAVVELLDTIRNRTLNMALELKSEVGSDQSLSDMSAAAAEQINTIIVNNIYGGNVYLASGQSHLNATTIQTVISTGDRSHLDQVLRSAGLADPELKELSEAIGSDGQQKMGSKVMAWVKTTAPKVLAGGVKMGAAVGQTLLIEWLKQYYGLSG
jgi:hypothetical protein